MEDKKNHVPLPSNYVTLAQLKERWLKQNEKEKELNEKQEQQLPRQEQHPKLHQRNPREHRRRRPKTQQRAWQVIQPRGTGLGSASGNRQTEKFGPKNGNISESNRVAIEVSCEKHQTLEAKADVGDENAGQDGKKKKSKKKKQKRVNRKPRADKEKEKLAEDAAQSTMEGDRKVANSDVQKVDDKTKIKIELKSCTSNNLMMEVEEKLGTLSMNSGSDEQNSGLRPYNSFRGSQRTYGGREYRNGPYGGREFRNGPYGGRKYNNGPYGGRFRGHQVQRRRGDEKIWVRKNEDSNGNVDKKISVRKNEDYDGNVDGIDKASGT